MLFSGSQKAAPAEEPGFRASASRFNNDYPNGKKSTSQILYDTFTFEKCAQPITGFEWP
jgi:hypothetical protein